MPFLFTNAALLAGLTALGLPIVLHLLLKRKNQRLRFSTNRFFQQQDTRSKSKKKLRNLLLLSMRLLIFALIAFAFARPYLPLSMGGGRAEPRRQMVVVLDRSLSLKAQDSTGPRWAGALKATRGLLSKLNGQDLAALVSCAPRSSVLTPFGPSDVTGRKLEGLEPTTGAADLADGLREALRLIALSEKGYAPSIAVVSDFQQSSCQNLASVKLPSDIDIQWVHIGDLAAPNIAVADLNLAAAETNKPFAVIANHGDEDLSGLESLFLVDGKPAGTRTVNIAMGSLTNVEWEMPKVSPGWHSAELRIRTKDSLPIDDTRYGAFYVPQALHVLVVEGKKGVRSFQEESFFLMAALDPNYGDTNAGPARFVIERCVPATLGARLKQAIAARAKASTGTSQASEAAAIPTLDPEVVVLPSARQLDSATAAVLQDYVQSGGGLLLFLGDGLSASRLNTDLSAILPAQIVKTENAEADFFWRVGDYDHRSPSLTVFQLPNSGNLGLTLFSHRYSLQTVPGSHTEASFDDGPPLLCSRNPGRGRVLMVNTSADTSWSDWPKHKTFVPWVHGAVAALANRAHESRIQPGETLVTDTDEELDVAGNGKQPLTLRDMDHKETSVTPNDHGMVDLHLSQPGVYSLRDDTGREVRRIAANIPVAESDLLSFKPVEIQKQLVREQVQPQTDLAAGLFGADRQRKEYWRLLLVAALAVLCLETLLSNRSNQ